MREVREAHSFRLDALRRLLVKAHHLLPSPRMTPPMALNRLLTALSEYLQSFNSNGSSEAVLRHMAARRELEVAWCVAVAVLREASPETSEES